MLRAEKCMIVDFEKKIHTEGYMVREVVPEEEWSVYCEKLGYVPELVEPDKDFHLKLTEDEIDIVRYCLAYYMSHNYEALRYKVSLNPSMTEWRIKVAAVLERVLFSFPPIEEVE